MAEESLNLLPVHSLESGSLQINILPLDHTNPYDYKREHRHTYYEIMLIEKPGGDQWIDFQNYPAHQDSGYIIFPQQVHLMNRKSSSGSVTQFTEDRIESEELRMLLRQLALTEGANILFEHDLSIRKDLELLLDLIKRHHHSGNSQLNTHLLQSFISVATQNQRQESEANTPPDKKLLFQFNTLLEKHYAEENGVGFYLKEMGCSDKKLSAVTRRYTGHTPLKLIHKRILLEVKRLLLFEDQSHKEIAYQLGFDSPSTFSAFVKTKTGFSPSELSGQLTEIHKK